MWFLTFKSLTIDNLKILLYLFSGKKEAYVVTLAPAAKFADPAAQTFPN